MNVNPINSVGRTAPSLPGNDPSQTQNAVNDDLTQASMDDSQLKIDATTGQPVPPRFPWLSRLSAQLEPVSKQPSPYGTTQIIGETVNARA